MADFADAQQRFGGVFDLSRSLFHGESAPTLVCNACQTVNRQSAQYCKGCAGKLPLFYASQRPPSAARPASRQGRCERAGGAARLPLARQTTAVRDFNSPAVGVALLIVVLFAAFGYWFTGHALVRPSSAAPTMMSSGTEPATLVTPLSPRRSTLVAGPVQPLRNVRPVQVAMTDADGPRRSMPRRVAANPLAACNALNFFARAVCLNNRCADAALSRSSACSEVHRQQRIAEVQRNPRMIN